MTSMEQNLFICITLKKVHNLKATCCIQLNYIPVLKAGSNNFKLS